LQKRSVKFSWERCEAELQRTFSALSVRQIHIYSVCEFFFITKVAFYWKTRLMYRLAGGFCVTNNLKHLFTDLPYFFIKNTDRFLLCVYTGIHRTGNYFIPITKACFVSSLFAGELPHTCTKSNVQLCTLVISHNIYLLLLLTETSKLPSMPWIFKH